MNKAAYSLIENYMSSCMEDSAHDKEHIYRVLYTALDIAQTEKEVNHDVLICACLLHDIGRKEQFENPKVCHAKVGADKAYHFLLENGFDEAFAEQVKDCIEAHRFRRDNPPRSIEAKILFDADKIDASGAIGIARTLMYKGQVSEPMYTRLPDGRISDGGSDEVPSFFQEYKCKLEKLYAQFWTKRGAELAGQRQQAAVDFYNNLSREVNLSYINGETALKQYVDTRDKRSKYAF